MQICAEGGSGLPQHVAERLRLKVLPRGGVYVLRSVVWTPVDAAGLRTENQCGRVLVNRPTRAADHVSNITPV